MKEKYSTGLRYGLVLGAIMVAYFVIFYLLNPRLLFNVFVYWASLGISIAVALQALRVDGAKYTKGEYVLSDALRTAFLVFIVGNAIYYVFYYVLFVWVDSALVPLQTEVMKEALEARKEMLPPEQQESLQEALDGDGIAVDVRSVGFSYLRSLIGHFVLALGLAFFITRR